ncbi:MAG: 30S ribosomal protein S2 [Candidatus Marinimicrobia bacterium]|nr:30S ribosomal protein S2 [Candidatus Neomarinimicrobiota bacterium]MCF7827540.1 30S ribosomal protein S2 [Candidatus Neomarinimicrobiota bacterium]MCF7881598.1 30S ribosomal protein S2 [Candidatus Neomarinimicrobiota bacterium]
MTEVNLEALIGAGTHFGHLTSKWNPKMKPYIFMEKNGIHIIDLKKTIEGLESALERVRSIVKDGGDILFVGTKKQAKDILREEASRCGMFYVVERWLGGTLTNFSTIKRSIRRLKQLEKDSTSGLYENLTKKEVLELEREREKLETLHSGIKDMKRYPEMLFVVDTELEDIAVAEAHRLDIPVVALVDTNADPEIVDYPIPGNDDSIRTIALITRQISNAVLEARGKSAEAGDNLAATKVLADADLLEKSDYVTSEEEETSEEEVVTVEAEEVEKELEAGDEPEAAEEPEAVEEEDSGDDEDEKPASD